MANWEEIRNYLKPKPPLYCPETPSLTQQVFLRSNALEALFGGAAGGGKSSALLMAALQYVDVPGYAAILFRKTYADLALPGALMDRFREWVSDYDDVHWNTNTYTATFPSGARITFGYLNNAGDYLRYKGAEFQFVGMDEVTEIREFDYKYLFSRLRRPDSGPLSKVPIRMRAASNPAPNWVRQRFLVEGEKENRIFVPSFFSDNPGIDHDAYEQVLGRLGEIERRQLLLGDWWVSSGGSMFNREDFVVIEPEDLPVVTPDTRFVRSWDLAASEEPEEGDATDPDYTAGALVMWQGGVTYVLDMKRERHGPAGVEKLVASTAADDGVHVAIRMEQEPGSSGKSMISHYSRNVLPGFEFDGQTATGDKATRARPLASAVRNGNVKLVRGPWNTDFLDEIANFPEVSPHDDQVDAVVGAYNFVAGISGKVKTKVSIVV